MKQSSRTFGTRESIESLPSVRNTEESYARNKTINYFGKKPQPNDNQSSINSKKGPLVETFGRNYQRSGASRRGSEVRNYVNESFDGAPRTSARGELNNRKEKHNFSTNNDGVKPSTS